MVRMLAESKRGRRAALALAALSVAGGVFGCRKDGGLAFRGAPIVIITVDTLRADHLPAYGYRGVETPNLDAFRKDAVLFENAYSHVPLTLPSHASIFTGLLPPQNGVRDNLGYALSSGPTTLAGYLKDKGYDTGAAVSAIVLSHATGIARGFDFYEDNVEPTKVSQSLSRVQRHGGETASLLEDWIGPRADRPFFAFLHLFEPHSPYEPPEPYASRYKLPYDGEIARADEIVGSFLKFLKDQDVYDRAVVVFLSDHGEGLNDHGEDEHGVLLYREAIHVPLMVKFPGSRRARGDGRSARRTDGRVSDRGAGGQPAGSARPCRTAAHGGASGGRRGPGRAAHLRGDALPAPSPGVERPRVAGGCRPPVHRVAASRALRPRRRSRREERPGPGLAAGLSLDARGAREDAAAAPAARRVRPGAGQEARGSRLHQRLERRLREERPAGAARPHRRGRAAQGRVRRAAGRTVRRGREESFLDCSRPSPE